MSEEYQYKECLGAYWEIAHAAVLIEEDIDIYRYGKGAENRHDARCNCAENGN
jgi:hypothetical protein